MSITEKKGFNLNPFEAIGKKWMLISAKDGDKVNTMTASWGGMGVIWGEDVVYIFVRQSRYTKEFIDNSAYFSLSFLMMSIVKNWHIWEGYQEEMKIRSKRLDLA